MTGNDDALHGLEDLFAELLRQQEERVREAGRRLVPGLVLDDLLCPDDIPPLRQDPEFLYQHGLYAGLLSAQAAVRAHLSRRRAGEDPSVRVPGAQH